jgi:hypothetical protein
MCTFRILESASRLVEHLEENGMDDEFLATFRAEWDYKKTMMMSEPATYTALLDEFAIRFVREAKSRNESLKK